MRAIIGVSLLLVLLMGLAEAATLAINERVIAVTIKDGRSGHAKDWIGLYRVGAEAQDRLAWKYLNNSQKPPGEGKTTATVYFTLPLGPGAYELRLYADDATRTRLATSPVITRDTPSAACADALTTLCRIHLNPSGLLTTFDE